MTTTSRSAGKREQRYIPASVPMEVRTLPDGSNQVSGYAIVFNSESLDLGGFTEICAPGMLDRTLTDSPDVLCLRDHKQELLLGRTTANTLKLTIDSKGLAFKLTLPNSPTGEDAAEAIRRGDLTSCSFGFATVQDDWAVTADGKVMRTLLDVNLFEISITSFPAYQATSVDVRSCPAALRSKITVRDASDCTEDEQDADGNCPGDPDYDGDDPDDEDRDETCSCECRACTGTGPYEERDCNRCENRFCESDSCDGCPFYDERNLSGKIKTKRKTSGQFASKKNLPSLTKAQRAAHRDLLLRRLG